MSDIGRSMAGIESSIAEAESKWCRWCRMVPPDGALDGAPDGAPPDGAPDGRAGCDAGSPRLTCGWLDLAREELSQESRRRVYAEFTHQSLTVHVDGSGAQPEPSGYLFAGHPFDQRDSNLSFARR